MYNLNSDTISVLNKVVPSYVLPLSDLTSKYCFEKLNDIKNEIYVRSWIVISESMLKYLGFINEHNYENRLNHRLKIFPNYKMFSSLIDYATKVSDTQENYVGAFMGSDIYWSPELPNNSIMFISAKIDLTDLKTRIVLVKD